MAQPLDIRVIRAQKGDTAAFEDLVREHQTRLYHTCLRMMANPDDARDMAQEILVKVWRNLPAFKGESSLSTWLYRIAMNTCLDELRRRKKAKQTSMEALAESGGLYNRWVHSLSRYEVDLWLPKFRTESRYELKDVLAALGVHQAFGNEADFSGITDDEKLRIDAVIHKTFIEVDEKKTEAAAATGITMVKTTAAAPNSIRRAEFHADRPFLYFIVDDASGLILFAGRQSFRN